MVNWWSLLGRDQPWQREASSGPLGQSSISHPSDEASLPWRSLPDTVTNGQSRSIIPHVSGLRCHTQGKERHLETTKQVTFIHSHLALGSVKRQPKRETQLGTPTQAHFTEKQSQARGQLARGRESVGKSTAAAAGERSSPGLPQAHPVR